MPRIDRVLPRMYLATSCPPGSSAAERTIMAKHRIQQSPTIWTALLRAFSTVNAVTEFVQRVVTIVGTVAGVVWGVVELVSG
jgi:hypothetical protein